MDLVLHCAIVSRLPSAPKPELVALARFLGIQASVPGSTQRHAELVRDVAIALTVPRDGRPHFVEGLQP